MVDYVRQNNSVLWRAPNYKDLELVLQYATDESFGSDDDGFGGALKFDQGTGFTAAVAYSKDIEVKGSINSLNFVTDNNTGGSIDYSGDVIRSAVTVDLDQYTAVPITLGLLYQQADYNFTGSDKEKGLIVSGEMQLKDFTHPTTVYLKYNKTDNLNGIGKNDSKQLVLGGEYQFKDNIIAHGYVGQNSADYTDPMDITNAVADIKVFAIGGGLEYLFQYRNRPKY